MAMCEKCAALEREVEALRKRSGVSMQESVDTSKA